MSGIPQVRVLGAGDQPPHTNSEARTMGHGDQPRLTIRKVQTLGADERQAQPRQTAPGPSSRRQTTPVRRSTPDLSQSSEDLF
ncbi:hypothetical protein TIFTF001_038731 [Ficus carica]|uniref:Uncharacterized protein n=1 Tax=Ficus carica TaxID=3494 RepID=A0AA88E8A2_FICCA|nr:hypothetical protein TIFTF001_038731 [Ficus carica]